MNERLDHWASAFEPELEEFVRGAASVGTPTLHEGLAFALGVDIADRSARGKRIRPALCLLTADALGADGTRAMPFALSIELMHNFCLVHDDIEDGDRMRRGRESVWIKYGVPQAINIGDYLLVQAQRALTHWGKPELDEAMRFRLMRLLTQTLDRTHIGQALDMNARESNEISVEDYMRIVREKTGYYLAAPIQGGAMVAGASEKVLEIIGAMAQVLGPMFQIMDDVIDLTEGKGRDAAGSDIREGKRSYLVAHAAESASASDREEMFNILDKAREETTREQVEWMSELFESCGAIRSARNKCRELHDESVASLKLLPASLASELGPVFESLANRTK